MKRDAGARSLKQPRSNVEQQPHVSPAGGAMGILSPSNSSGKLVDHMLAEAFGNQPAANQTLREAIEWALVRRGLDQPNIVEDLPPVFGLALQALRHSTLHREFIFVLAATMDKRISHRVLPSHIEVLRQLSNDEYTILNQLSTGARGSPVATASLVPPNGSPMVVSRNLLAEPLAELLNFKDNIPQYIDNLARLGLITIRPEAVAPEAVYRSFARYDFLKELLTSAPPRSRIAITPYAASLTDFGRGLRAICSC